jgi:hypothetical protein
LLDSAGFWGIVFLQNLSCTHLNKQQHMTHFGNTNNQPLLVAMFSDRDNAEKAYNELKDLGYQADEINVIMTSEGHSKHFEKHGIKTEMGNKALEGTGAGAAIGGIAGGIAGAIAALGSNLIIPGLGLVVLGPLAAGLAGAGAGGLTGGLIGALVGAGIPEEKSKVYEEGLKRGNIIIAVHPHNAEDLRSIPERWKEYHATDVVYS